MKWTTEKPTEPGWWLVEEMIEGAANPLVSMTEVYVGDHEDDRGRLRARFFDGTYCRLDRIRAKRWAGPIPTPEEP